MLEVRNTISECKDGDYQARESTNLLVVHQISFANDNGGKKDNGKRLFPDVVPIPDIILNGPKTCERFADTRRVDRSARHHLDRPGTWTNGQNPYTWVQRTDGVLDQCLPLRELGIHARRWNRQALSVAVVGNFRRKRPCPGQWEALVQFCGLWMATGISIYGHTELPGASTDPMKQCPGQMFSMEELRRVAKWVAIKHTAESAYDKLMASGVTP